MSFCSLNGRRVPSLLDSKADNRLRNVAARSSKIYVFKLFPFIAAAWGRNVSLSVGDEEACAALTTGAGKDKVAFMLVFAPWAIAARYDIWIWTERVPTKVKSVDLPSRIKKLPFPSELKEGLAAIVGPFSTRDIFSDVLACVLGEIISAFYNTKWAERLSRHSSQCRSTIRDTCLCDASYTLLPSKTPSLVLRRIQSGPKTASRRSSPNGLYRSRLLPTSCSQPIWAAATQDIGCGRLKLRNKLSCTIMGRFCAQLRFSRLSFRNPAIFLYDS